MASDRIQRQIERLLDEADAAVLQFDWEKVRQCAQAVLRLDPRNNDALSYLAAADRGPDESSLNEAQTSAPKISEQPSSFASGRYQVKRFLGEGGKKKVYLAQDTLLDREVAFALIKTEGPAGGLY